MGEFAIYTLGCGGGTLGICPIPGRFGSYTEDLKAVLAWCPDMVLTMTHTTEMQQNTARDLGADLKGAGIAWHHLPVADFGAPQNGILPNWPTISKQAHAIFTSGGRVLVHCAAGCGRSGMIAMRLLVERGAAPDAALAQLRAVRPCAVETEAQRLWASAPYSHSI